jgi:hypothetical protein
MSAPANRTPNTHTPAVDEAKRAGGDLAQTASEEGRHVAAEASEQAKEVIAHAQREARSLAEESKAHAFDVAASATAELEDQLGERLGAATDVARTTAEEFRALCEGRPEDAGRSAEVLRQAGTRLDHFADRVDQLGVRGVAEEVSDFARRRPVAFLASAAVAGLLVGRIARAERDQPDATSSPDGQAAMGRDRAIAASTPAAAPSTPAAPPSDPSRAMATAVTGAPMAGELR